MTDFTIAEQMLYSAVKLTSKKNGIATGTGTGFFVDFANNGEQRVPCIVTNKHVIENADQVTALCHLADGAKPSGRFVTCTTPLTPQTVFNHPVPEVDLCAISFGPILSQANEAKTPVFVITLGLDLIPADDDWANYDAIEEVTMIGFPRGMSDEANNLPLVRRGITATSLGKRYNNKPEFMVDMACFPGSSGSPVFVFDRNGFHDRKTRQYRVGASRLHLAGVLYSGPMVTNTGQIVLATPPQFSVATMMHLGYVIRATELRVIDGDIRSRLFAASKPTF
ncbi:MAG: serine protease [Hyphomicrobiaceae bacterium]|nr:serine protease [Hyphomicrobiaceae bacterium]